MCTYRTRMVALEGSGKGASRWFPLTSASVYVDHAVHAPADHTLSVDFLNREQGPSARVAVELTVPAARELALAILAALPEAPGPNGAHDRGAQASGHEADR